MINETDNSPAPVWPVVGQLLPCPFCGCEAKYKTCGHDGEWAFHKVECQSCGVMQMMYQKSPDEVVRRWNARRVDVNHLQLMVQNAGFKYWRASDSHGVKGTKEHAELFISDLIGVEVEVCLPNAKDQRPAHENPDMQPGPDGGSGASTC
jgi:Lar family restriction alleviation protein